MKKAKVQPNVWSCYTGGCSINFGLVLLILGLYLLARDLGWLPPVSLWAIILIALGVYFLSSNLRR